MAGADDAAAAAQAERDSQSLRMIEAGQLPLRAQERLARMQGRAFTSALSVPAFAVVDGIGFDPVGQVLGTCVYALGYTYANCGAWGAYGMGGALGGMGGFSGAAVTVADVPVRRSGLRDASARALSRLAAEARGLAADGVVDVTLTWTQLEGMSHTLEVQAIGTAVRARGDGLRHLGAPFLSDLSGQDVTLLLRGGWAPTGVVVGLSVCIRHDDYWTRQAQSAWAGNAEVPGVTELVTVARQRARLSAAHDAAGLGGTALVVRAVSLRTWEQEPSDGHRDHLAEASVIGTSIVPFRTRPTARPPTVAIMRLSGARATDPRKAAL